MISKETLTSLKCTQLRWVVPLGGVGLCDQSSANISYNCLNHGKLPFYMDKKVKYW